MESPSRPSQQFEALQMERSGISSQIGKVNGCQTTCMTRLTSIEKKERASESYQVSLEHFALNNLKEINISTSSFLVKSSD